MTDDRLREAERAFRETGDVSAETRLLQERVRAGLLAKQRLELAAELGYDAAALVLGRPAGPRPWSFVEAVRAAARFGEAAERRALELFASPATGAPRTEAARVAAIHFELVRWALSPHEPHARRAPTPGSLVELRIGSLSGPETSSALLANDEIGIGDHPAALIRVPFPVGRCACAIVRAGTGFTVRNTYLRGTLFREAEAVEEAPIATGDVISFGEHRLEVRIHDAPFSDEVEQAFRDAQHLLDNPDDEPGRRRLRLAAKTSHLGATLAATRLGIALRPELHVPQWIETIYGLGPREETAALLRLAREAEPAFTAEFPGITAFRRILTGVESWLRAPDEATKALVVEAKRELSARVGVELDLTGDTPQARGFSAAMLALRLFGDELALWPGVVNALHAGIRGERVRAIVEDEIIRWALGR